MISNPEQLRAILQAAKVIAVVGHSDKPHRTSYQIAQQLRHFGYRVYPINPTVREIDGEPSYPSLAAVPEPIDIVNVFRRPEHLPAIVEDAIAVNAKTIWGQLGVIHAEAAASAEAAGLNVVMDNCIKVTYYQVMP